MPAHAAGNRTIAAAAFALCAVCTAAPAAASQVTARPPADTARVQTDSAPPRDSIKTPFPGPVISRDGIGRYHWARDQIFQTGAVNAAELIARIPGAAIIRSGFVMAPQVITWHGETGRVRVFLDGVELDALNSREGGVRDLSMVAVWELQEIIAEATPSELRVHLQTWRMIRTAPETRVDVLTGDFETNLYRGFFGRRFQSGFGLQFGFEQVGTQVRTVGGDGDALSLFGRLGWAAGSWSFDVVAQRDRRTRNSTTTQDQSATVPPFKGSEFVAYARLGYRNPDSAGMWAQLIAARDAFSENSEFRAEAANIPADSADTSRVSAQYIASAGVRFGNVRASALARVRSIDDETYLSPAVRASWETPRLALEGVAEHAAHDSTLRADAGVRVAPLVQRLILTARASLRRGLEEEAEGDALFLRADAAVRLGRMWFRGGMIRRDSVVSAPPVVFAAGFIEAVQPAATGTTFGASGKFFKDLGLDVDGTLWESELFHRPARQYSARLWLDSDWRSRFPQGHFTIRMSVLAERREGYLVPLESGDVAMVAATPFTSNLEIRIKSATISWQFRNFMGAVYETVPGFRMPSRINLYGVRWTFTN